MTQKNKQGKCPVCGKPFLYAHIYKEGSKPAGMIVHKEELKRAPFPHVMIMESCTPAPEHLALLR